MGYVPPPEPSRGPTMVYERGYVGQQRIPTPVIPPSVDYSLIDSTDYPPLIDAFTLGRIMFTAGWVALVFVLVWVFAR